MRKKELRGTLKDRLLLPVQNDIRYFNAIANLDPFWGGFSSCCRGRRERHPLFLYPTHTCSYHFCMLFNPMKLLWSRFCYCFALFRSSSAQFGPLQHISLLFIDFLFRSIMRHFNTCNWKLIFTPSMNIYYSSNIFINFNSNLFLRKSTNTNFMYTSTMINFFTFIFFVVLSLIS